MAHTMALALIGAVLVSNVAAAAPGKSSETSMERWTKEKANGWYHEQPWLVGCNFIPSTAVNQLEMWQAETFDPETIDRELGWAAGIGFNAVRVYLHDLAWEAGADGFTKRIERFLGMAAGHRIRVLFVIFDDCWNDSPRPGTQPNPIPGVHNSGWLQSPGRTVVNDSNEWPRLEAYVKGLIGTFREDGRILGWDLYNEPGNSGQGIRSLPLLKKAFEWARAAKPSQPLTAGLWCSDKELNAFQLTASDVITFHNYNDAASLTRQIAELKAHGRPLLCTEWLRRPISTIPTHLPIFKRERVGCLNWGLVSGKTQTIYPWGSKKGDPEPPLWFHDLLRKDGTPLDQDEISLFRELTKPEADSARAAVHDPATSNASTPE